MRIHRSRLLRTSGLAAALTGSAAVVALVASSFLVPAGAGPSPASSRGAGHAGHAGPAVPDPAAAELSGFAVLPADTFVPGSERSGHFTTHPGVPFPDQPVQGFSGVHALGGGEYLVMSDNGFGAKANSQDFQLRVHRVSVQPGSRDVAVLEGGFTLSDPRRLVRQTIWRDGGCQAAASLPAGYACPARDRVLTGWDFDLESMQVAPDGTFYFGEEFGPYLLHTDARGRLLEAPLATPGVASPSNPDLQPGQTPNLANSKGFEGMAISPNGRHLYPMLEGPLAEDVAAGRATDLRVYEVRRGSGRHGLRHTGDTWTYRMESAENAIGDFVAVDRHRFLVIERDNLSGAAARFKRVYLVDERDRDRDGVLDKQLLVDLMAVPDPRGLSGLGATYAMPYVTIEDVELLDDDTIVVINDNNYPATGGRGADVEDVTEVVTIDLAGSLDVDRRLLPATFPGTRPPARS